MRVKVSSSVSSPTRVASGVPQGSVMAPILFLIYINHAVANLTCQFKIFADDIKLYLGFSSGDILHAQVILQKNIDLLVKTSQSWGLNMSPGKCAVIRFSPRSSSYPFFGPSPYHILGSFINFTDSYSDLGIVIDRTLKFHCHTDRAARIAGGITTNIFSSTLSRDSSFLINIYRSHVRPKLEYGSNLWNLGYVEDTKLMERVQKRWTRAVTDMSEVYYGVRLRTLGLFSFKGRLLRNDLVLVWKIVHGKCGISPSSMFTFVSGRSTRGHSLKIYVERANLEVRRRFFSMRVVEAWNALSEETVTSDEINSFKSFLHRDLGEQLYDYFE